MKVSLQMAQSVSNVPLHEIGTDELVKKIGAQLGAVEEVIHYGPRYEGIVVVKVVSCEKHPDADKLSVCKVDDAGVVQGVDRDENGHVQVVCGAPNVREGLMVAWLPPGATVPSTIDKDPFVLGARELRGVISNGMLASPAELAISENHEGILEIDEVDAKPGQAFRELYGLDDTVIDIENKMFTHRPDCFGALGVARELAGIQGQTFKSPEWYLNGQLPVIENPTNALKIQVDTPLVPRFMAVAMTNVTVGPSPVWLQASLARVGIKSINNIVDVTNYLMYLTGQPLHAYDADKLPTPLTLNARMSRSGEKVALLNGKELELQDESSVVITSGDSVVGIGGVMGGKDTEVSDATKNIVIECASFDMYNIRRTSMKYGLFTDAVTRFNKGQSSLQNPVVLAKAIEMMGDLAGGTQASNVSDVHQGLPTPNDITVSTDFINARLGSSLSVAEMTQLLANVECHVFTEGDVHFVAPFWRTDLEIAEDVVEEIGRLYGYDNLPLSLPNRPSKPASRNALLELKTRIRTILSSAGANELLTYSFIHGNLLKKVSQNTDHAFELSNAISPDLQYFRTSLTPSLLERVHPNVKAGYGRFAVFELGTVHNKLHSLHEDGLPKEFPTVSLVCTDAKSEQPAYFQARAYVDFLCEQLAIRVRYQQVSADTDDPVIQPYDPARSALVVQLGSGKVIGVVGELKQSTQQALKLPRATAALELDLPILQELLSDSAYTKLSRFPSVQQDITLRVPRNVSFQSVQDVLNGQLDQIERCVTHLETVDIYQSEVDSDHQNLTFRFTIAHYDKTLMSEEVNRLLDQAASAAHEKLGAERL